MKTSAGNNLPIDPQSGMFMAGDVRAQEEPGSYGVTNLVRARAQLPGRSAGKAAPELDRRSAVSAGEGDRYRRDCSYQLIRSSCAHLLGPGALTAYHGYDPTVNPRRPEEFAGPRTASSFDRLGGKRAKFGGRQRTLSEEDLKNSFFEPPSTLRNRTGGERTRCFAISAPTHQQRALDVHIVDDLRNS